MVACVCSQDKAIWRAKVLGHTLRLLVAERSSPPAKVSLEVMDAPLHGARAARGRLLARALDHPAGLASPPPLASPHDMQSIKIFILKSSRYLSPHMRTRIRSSSCEWAPSGGLKCVGERRRKIWLLPQPRLLAPRCAACTGIGGGRKAAACINLHALWWHSACRFMF